MIRFAAVISRALPALLCLMTLALLMACSSNGPINPITVDDGSKNNNPPLPTNSSPGNQDTIKKLEPDITSDINPFSGDFTTETVESLTEALNFLKESNGGVSTTQLDPDQFVIHIWDRNTGANLHGEAVVVCTNGPTSLVTIKGVGLFENATFPLSATVKVPGYALASICSTTGNIVSLGMERLETPGDATIFGVADSLGVDKLAIYSSDLLPTIQYEFPSQVNPDFIQYEIEVPSGTSTGFSAFLDGVLDFGNLEPDPPYHFSGIFFVTNNFSWEFEPLNETAKRFYALHFDTKSTPAGSISSTASIPAEYWSGQAPSIGLSRAWVIPTAIFLEGERYLAMGPYAEFTGDDPSALDYTAFWFANKETPDRTVLSAQLVLPDGSIDIVHGNWHINNIAPEIKFSGMASLDVAVAGGGGYSLPEFSITNPLGSEGTLTRIEVMASGINPVWDITFDGQADSLDTSNLSVPLTWIQELYLDHEIEYRVECMNSLSQDIDDYTEDQIIMTREEVCFSPWTGPQA